MITAVLQIGIQIGTLAIAAIYVLFKRYVNGKKEYGWGFFWPRGRIASAKGPYPQWKLATFSIGDQLNASITGLANPFLSVTIQGILTNFAILWTALFSAIFLGARYHQTHFIGCVLVVASSLVAVACLIQSGDIGTYVGPDSQVYTSSALWYVIYIIGTVPNGFSNVWKQHCLKSVDLEIMFATTWSGMWQVLWGILFFPMQWIPLPPPAEVTTPKELPSYLADSVTCFFGTSPSDSQLDQACEAQGGSAALWFMVYVIFNLFFNVLLLWLTKRMSALWASIATVLCLDLASLFSMSPALMGDEATLLSFSDYLGLVVAGIAMWAYCLMPEMDKHGNEVAGVSEEVKEMQAKTIPLSLTTDSLAKSAALHHLDRNDDSSFNGASDKGAHSFMHCPTIHFVAEATEALTHATGTII